MHILGEHQEWAKYSNYESALRVPLAIYFPGSSYASNSIESAQHNSTSKHKRIYKRKYMKPVELLDLMPTIIDLAGLPSIPECTHNQTVQTCTEGKSLEPLFSKFSNGRLCNKHSDIQSYSNCNYAFSQYPRPALYPEPDSDEPVQRNIKYMGYSVRSKRYRYTQWVGSKTDYTGKIYFILAFCFFFVILKTSNILKLWALFCKSI